MDKDDITFTGMLVILVRCIGWVALIGIPVFLLYKILKWVFFD